MKRIGVLTSGGDAPGMNAAIRAVVRSACAKEVEALGINHGYSGLLESDFTRLDSRAVGNILQRGGTILHTSRCPEFRTREGRAKAAQNLREAGVDGLITIGGNGTFTGALELVREHAIPVVGVPGTIDNDIYGTDFTVGYDTAVNTALEAIDRIRDTAASHERIFLIEVMGRDSGFMALDVALAGGAEAVVLPEFPLAAETVLKSIAETHHNKHSSVVVVAEGAYPDGVNTLRTALAEHTGEVWRSTVLGHVQRGGSPTARDRILASRLGAAAVDTLLNGSSGVMVGEVDRILRLTPLQDAISRKKPLDLEIRALAELVA